MTTRLPPDPSGKTGHVSVTGSPGVQVGDFNQQINHVAHVLVEPADPGTVNAPPGMNNLPCPAGGPFVGRDETVARLLSMVDSDKAVIGQILYGLGGVGKTRLALQYAHAARERYSLVWWINADTSERITLGLADLAQRLLGGPVLLADARSWAVGWLQEHPGWLLVLDDVENLAEIESLLGQLRGQGRVLVTTRRDLGGSVWGRLRLKPMRLTMLERAASIDLLTNSSANGTATDEAADLLAEYLGDLPLALEQAAAYISQRHISISEYRRRLIQYPDRMFGTAPEGFPEGTALQRVWALTMAAIADRLPLASKVLRVLSFLAPDELPAEVPESLGEGPMEVEDALALLASYCMITWVDDMLSVHRLVQEVTRLRPIAGETVSPVAAAVRLLANAVNANPWGEPSSWSRWNILLPHIAAVSFHLEGPDRAGEVSSLLDRAATYLEGQGQFDRAIEIFTSVLTDRRQYLGNDDPLTLVAGNNLARAYQSAGRAAEAIPIFEAVLKGLRRISGASDPNTLAVGDNLAAAYLAMGRWDEAISLLETILPTFEDVLRESEHVSVCRSNLAFAYQSVGKLAEAISLFEVALQDARRQLGNDHPATLMAGNNLAQAYRFAGRSSEAIDLYDEVVAGACRVMGYDHPDVLIFRKNQADLYRSLGRAKDAILLLETVLEDYRRIMGPDHPSTLICRDNLATSYQCSGRQAEAVAQFESLLSDFSRVLGDDNPSTRICRNNLAFSYYDAGRFAEAVDVYEVVLSDNCRNLGDDHPDTKRVRRTLESARQAVKRQRRPQGG